jgi:hypothetical protein
MIIHKCFFNTHPVALCTLRPDPSSSLKWAEITCLDCIRGEIRRLEVEVHLQKMFCATASKTMDEETGKRGGALRARHFENIQQMLKSEEYMRQRSISHPWRWDSATNSPILVSADWTPQEAAQFNAADGEEIRQAAIATREQKNG